MPPLYPPSFFAFQLAFASRIAARFTMPLADAVRRYTPVAVNIRAEGDWGHVAGQIERGDDPLSAIYQLYLERCGDERLPQPDDALYHGYPLFGCFFFNMRDELTISTHFLSNDLPGTRPLGHERLAARQDDLRRMFTLIYHALPQATTVRGHSWLYNLPAYRRIFPPSYTQAFVENPDGVLEQMVLWFQCYHRDWEVNPTIADQVLARVDQVGSLDDLRHCFPYQRLRTQAPIEDFYRFYQIAP